MYTKQEVKKAIMEHDSYYDEEFETFWKFFEEIFDSFLKYMEDYSDALDVGLDIIAEFKER